MNKSEELPDDMWEEILVRVPATESAMELRRVCKRWCELINSDNYQISHLNHWRSSRIPTLKVITKSPFRRPGVLLSLDLAGRDVPSKVTCCPLRLFEQLFRRHLSDLPQKLYYDVTECYNVIFDCYDGLFLVQMSDQHLFLTNPLTNSYLPLPLPKKGVSIITHYAVAYDPSTPKGYVIFRFDSASYRQIGLVSSLRIQLNNNTVRSDWRQIWSSSSSSLLTFPEYINISFSGVSISINGKVHWLFFFSQQDSIVGKSGILTLDASTEEAIVTHCSSATPKGTFFKSSTKFYCLTGAKYSSIDDDILELWAVDDVLNNPTWLKHHVIIKTDFERKRIHNFWDILIQGNRLIIGFERTADVFIYDLSIKKWHTLDIVDSEDYFKEPVIPRAYCRRFMSIHYSLLRW